MPAFGATTKARGKAKSKSRAGSSKHPKLVKPKPSAKLSADAAAKLKKAAAKAQRHAAPAMNVGVLAGSPPESPPILAPSECTLRAGVWPGGYAAADILCCSVAWL